MGLTHAEISLRNLFNNKNITVRALVDTGALYLCVPDAVARRLGFDPEEAGTVRVTLADGQRKEVPRVAPVEIAFGNRTYVTEALVLGDEPLLGVLPLEAMDLIVDPRKKELLVNPAHPDVPLFHAKGARS